MNKEEKEQWLYEAYKYTSNFDFSRLDKYEEVNDDICIDAIILDYTMLYEFHKEEIERLNTIIKHTDSWIDRTIEIIKQQPSGNDEWILERLNGIKQCLKDSDKEWMNKK